MNRLISIIFFLFNNYFRLIDTFLKVRETNQENLGVKKNIKKAD